ncbi:hypothetical protein BJ138DRAFT_1151649 [Hygrophoropsis aurantiaca]|uniref:Uncharacterized protein n=1 Tax=Hygrophoropsis aurantiaca TaxID=72124 RepID=A0ACB8AE20_9AGAM|nr:hypothetical protein BJ138DRAFT_1151649 [Hygrophoropsis aurantiaca]
MYEFTPSPPPIPQPHHDTMDSPKLRKLTRAQIQAIAKREVVRAVGKTEEIIRRLLKKHPGGIPKREVSVSPPPPPVPPKDKGKQPIRAWVAGINATPAEQDPIGRHTEIHANNAPATVPLSYVPVQVHGITEQRQFYDEEYDDACSYISYPRVEAGPDERDVQLVLRQFTTLVNETPEIEKLIRETEMLTDRAAAIMQSVEPRVRSACETRQRLEEDYLGKLKDKRERWDGTAFMDTKHRRRWIKHLKRQRQEKRDKTWEDQAMYDFELGIEPLEYNFYFENESDPEGSLWSSDSSVSGRGGKRRKAEEAGKDGRRKRTRQ